MNQDNAFELMTQSHNIFLTGMAGTGKSYLLNKFIEWAEENGKIVATTASTGIAASHINGITIHSWSGIGIHSEESLTEETMDKIANNPYLKNTIEIVDILIIDEISMLHAYQLDGIDYICSKIRRNSKPFGGIQVILTGDFLQLPPVSKTNTLKYAFESSIWNNSNLQICYLREIYRQDDPTFIEILNEVRYGQENTSSFNILKQCVDKQIEINDPTELYPLNRDVDYINIQKLNMITKPPKTYSMKCYGEEGGINYLKRNMITPEKLILKEGAHVIFTKNNFKEGYTNGTFGIVVNIDKNPTVQLTNGNKIFVTPATWEIRKFNYTSRQYEVKASVSQIPLKLAYALTTHKSQGFTLEYAKINLSNLFSYNMGYVALSRVKSLKNLTLTNLDNTIYLVDKKLIEHDYNFREQSKIYEK